MARQVKKFVTVKEPSDFEYLLYAFSGQEFKMQIF